MKKLILILAIFVSGRYIYSQKTYPTITFQDKNGSAWTFCQDFHPYKNIIALGLDDKRIMLYDIDKKLSLRSLHCKGAISDLKFSPEGNYLAAVDFSGYFYLWETQSWTLKIISTKLSECLNTVCIDNVEQYAYCGSGNGAIFKIDINTHKQRKYIVIQSAITKITLSSPTIYIGTDEGNLYQFNQKTGIARSIEKYDDGAAVIAMKSNGKYLYWAKQNGTIKKLDKLSKESLPLQEIKTEALNGFDVISELIATGDKEGRVCIQCRNSKKKLFSEKFLTLISSLCFSKDQHYLSITFADGQFIVLNLMKISYLQPYLPMNFTINQSTRRLSTKNINFQKDKKQIKL